MGFFAAVQISILLLRHCRDSVFSVEGVDMPVCSVSYVNQKGWMWPNGKVAWTT